jgi:hypothetical protein
MPATPSQAKDGLKARLATILGLRCYDYQPDQVNPPFAFPTLEEIRYHATAMGTGGVEMDFTINLILSRQSERVAQDEIDKYTAFIGAQSVRAAIEGDRTLGGVVDDCVVRQAGNISNIDANDTLYVAVDFRVTVYA